MSIPSVPEISYNLATVAAPAPLELEEGDLALLVFIGQHDRREELLWVRVVECLQECVHRAEVLTAEVLTPSALFHDLPQGEVIYFRPEHVLRARLRSGEFLTRVGWVAHA